MITVLSLIIIGLLCVLIIYWAVQDYKYKVQKLKYERLVKQIKRRITNEKNK